MNNDKLNKAIEAHIQSRKENPLKYKEDYEERQDKKLFYQSYTKEKILAMEYEEFYKYISRLWSMLIWGNKAYIVDKLIKDNGLEKIKNQLADLIYGKQDIINRWDLFLKEIKGLGAASISEILSYVYPSQYVIFNSQIVKCLSYLEVSNLPKYNYQYTGERYKNICNTTSNIAKSLANLGIKNVDLITVDYFIWDEILPLSNNIVDVIIKKDMGKTSFDESKSLHDEIQSKILDIGKWLGFQSEAEVKVAHGAVVDVVWEAQIGNMGKAIYVFEVQSKGSIDSLILNLKRSQTNPAVQAVVAISDEKQIEKIKKESKGVIDENSLRTWEIDDILMVHESLANAHESINKLSLVPDSFPKVDIS